MLNTIIHMIIDNILLYSDCCFNGSILIHMILILSLLADRPPPPPWPAPSRKHYNTSQQSLRNAKTCFCLLPFFLKFGFSFLNHHYVDPVPFSCRPCDSAYFYLYFHMSFFEKSRISKKSAWSTLGSYL